MNLNKEPIPSFSEKRVVNPTENQRKDSEQLARIEQTYASDWQALFSHPFFGDTDKEKEGES